MKKTIKRYSDSTPANAKLTFNEQVDEDVGDEYHNGTGYDAEFKPFKLRRK